METLHSLIAPTAKRPADHGQEAGRPFCPQKGRLLVYEGLRRLAVRHAGADKGTPLTLPLANNREIVDLQQALWHNRDCGRSVTFWQ